MNQIMGPYTHIRIDIMHKYIPVLLIRTIQSAAPV